MAEIVKKLPTGTAVELWFQDEMRVGQKNKLTYRWARKGTRYSAVKSPGPGSTCLRANRKSIPA